MQRRVEVAFADEAGGYNKTPTRVVTAVELIELELWSVI